MNTNYPGKGPLDPRAGIIGGEKSIKIMRGVKGEGLTPNQVTVVEDKDVAGIPITRIYFRWQAQGMDNVLRITLQTNLDLASEAAADLYWEGISKP